MILNAVPTKMIIARRQHQLIKRTDLLLLAEECWTSVCAWASALRTDPSVKQDDANPIAGILALRALSHSFRTGAHAFRSRPSASQSRKFGDAP